MREQQKHEVESHNDHPVLEDNSSFDYDAFLGGWRSDYYHPLILGSIQREARTLGIEIKTQDEWQQFLKEQDVGGIFSSPDDKRKISGYIQPFFSQIMRGNRPEAESII